MAGSTISRPSACACSTIARSSTTRPARSAPPAGLDRARELAAGPDLRPSELTARARGHSGVELAIARALGADWLDRFVRDWRAVRLEIDGSDLLAAGVPEGPAIGRGLA